MSADQKPLEGILVVALEQAVAAPYCSSRLADAGARVIKIERPEGDFCREYDHVAHGESAYFVWLNRGKESVCLDIKNPEDNAILANMVARADVFIQNLAPGAAARIGFGSEALRSQYPRLITVDISGYGESGPYREMKAYDLLVQCETGLASITGSPEAPGRVGVSLCDISCGMYAYSAVLEAILERKLSGTGKAIKLSLFDCLADWMTVPLLHQDYAGKAPERVGLNHPSIAPYGAYASASGEQVVFSIQNEREWLRLCAEVLGQPELAADSRFASNAQRCSHRPALDEAIVKVFATMSLDEICDRLFAAKIAFGRVNSVAQFSAHPQLRRMAVATPTGPVNIVSPPTRFEQGEMQAVPALGQHTASLKQEFGN